MGTTGLTNVSIGVPVTLQAGVADPKTAPADKYTWTLTAPSASKAKLSDPAAAKVSFTPDVVGAYKVDVVASNKGVSGPMASVTLHAGTYIGADKGGCKNCHTEQAAEWAKTGHATIMTRNLDEDPTKHYGEGCLRCHTTGYYIGVANGGFADVQAKTGWKFPTKIGVKGTFDKIPTDLKALGNIQCENCHGPAKEHVVNKAKVTEASFDEGVCNVCHSNQATGLKSAKHAEEESTAWNYPIGPDRVACVRCHSGKGYASFLKNPTEPATWDYSKQTLVCAACHDPHSEKNTFQLRIVGKPVALPFEAKDVGLSATCFECHNARTKPEDALKATFPHYSSAAEFLSDTGGVTYGQTVLNSPHSMMIGKAAVPDPADKTGKAMLFGGNVPGPCVTCHMWPTIADAKDPNRFKVGAHSFNTVSPDGKFDYGEACKSCHGEVKDFNLKAKADYDGNGKVEGVQDEVKGLLGVLWKALEEKGLKKVDTGYPYATLPKDADDKIKNAWYNYRTVYGVMWGAAGPGNEGKAQAIHNFKRAVMLLQLSYKDLTGKDVPGATLIK